MLTVRLIAPDGHERLKEMKYVHYDPLPDTPRVFLFPNEDGLNDFAETINEGDVYIMNSNGKTVAVYHLGIQPKSDKA